MKKTTYFVILLLLAISVSLSSCNEKNNSSDEKFYSEEYKFKVDFPENPKVDKEEEVTDGLFVQTFMYESGNDGNMIVAGRMNELYEELFKGNESELSISVRDATLENLNATLTKDKDIEYEGVPANYYEAKGNFEGVDYFFRGINIINGNLIYVIVVFKKFGEVTDKEYNDFIDSFELVD